MTPSTVTRVAENQMTVDTLILRQRLARPDGDTFALQTRSQH
jgi:hypothetical protein